MIDNGKDQTVYGNTPGYDYTKGGVGIQCGVWLFLLLITIAGGRVTSRVV